MNRAELLRECFGQQHRPKPPSLTIEASDGPYDIASHIDIYWRDVLAEHRKVTVAGIGNVCTDPAYRSLGLASALIRAAHRIALSRDVLYAAVFSSYAPFYERLGYHPTPVEHFLVAPLAGVPWPIGRVDPGGKW